MTRRKSIVFPWVLVALWICVIWGHSMMSGEDSSTESQMAVDLLRKAVAWLYTSDVQWVRDLVAEHPGIVDLLLDTERLHYLIRKAAHFTEYFVLGVLVVNAVYRTLRGIFSSLLTIAMFWACVPGIDEYIQRFVPGRAGMFRDVLIDMGGFGTALVASLPFVALGAGISALSKGSRHFS